jgi:hypothetical protein
LAGAVLASGLPWSQNTLRRAAQNWHAVCYREKSNIIFSLCFATLVGYALPRLAYHKRGLKNYPERPISVFAKHNIIGKSKQFKFT